MPRPLCCRRITRLPVAVLFAPSGVPGPPCEAIILTLDELEALRLADLEGLYQEHAASQMAISRSTFGRIVEVAHRKVAEALVQGKTLRIEGGAIADRGAAPHCPRCAGTSPGATACPRCSTAAAPPDLEAPRACPPPIPCGVRRRRGPSPTT